MFISSASAFWQIKTKLHKRNSRLKALKSIVSHRMVHREITKAYLKAYNITKIPMKEYYKKTWIISPSTFTPIASKLLDVLLLQILSILVACILRIAGFALLLVKSPNPQSHHGDTYRVFFFCVWPLNI